MGKKSKRNLIVEVGVVLNFPLLPVGLIGVFSSEDVGRGFAILLTTAALYNLIAYYLLGRRIERLEG